MTLPILLVSVLLVAVVVLFVTEKVAPDLTSIGIMVALILLGLLSPKEALAGFSNPAPITVGALFIVGAGLMRTGALDFVSAQIMMRSQGKEKRLLLLALALTGLFSAFLNNTPVVILFMSLFMPICCAFNLSPSKYFMPISFMSILAGTTTLIGTSTNIIVSDIGAQYGMAELGMFELSVLGVPIALLGGAFLYFFSNRLMPAHKEPICEVTDDHKQHYVSELMVPEGSELIGVAPIEGLCKRCEGVEVYEVLRGPTIYEPDDEAARLQANDIILAKASARELVHLLDQGLVVLPKGDGGTQAKPFDERSLMIELIVPPNSEFMGRLLTNVMSAFDAHIHVLGVKRRHLHYSQQRLQSLRLQVGDILLVQCPHDHIPTLRAGGDFIVVYDALGNVPNRRKAPIAIAVFALMIAAAATGLADILTCALTAAFLMIVTRSISLSQAYRSVDVHVLLLLIGTLALGSALQETGAAEFYAKALLSTFQGLGAHAVLSVFILITSVTSLFVSNTATAVLLLPIGIATAAQMGVDPRAFVVGTCFGASACFATPVGYQTNLLVYGPGGYRFRDFLRLGLPLNALVWIAASLFVPVFWPL